MVQQQQQQQRQICKVCGRPDKFNFNLPDKIWSAIVPKKYVNNVVCLYCFDDFAKSKDIPYAAQIDRLLWFAGDAANLIWDLSSYQDM